MKNCSRLASALLTRGLFVCVIFAAGTAATLAAVGPWRGARPLTAAPAAVPWVPPAVEIDSVVLRPQDTYLNLNATNYSADPILATYTWPDRQVANAIVMKFDFSGLPAGAVIQQATLGLSLVQSDSVADGYAVSAQKITGRAPVIAAATGYTADGVTAWTATACCYSGVPLAQADLSSPYDVQVIDRTPGIKLWTITGMAHEWLADAASNFGLVLNSDASKLKDRFRYFASMENTDPNLRPYLRVTYSAPDTTPPAVGLTSPAAGTSVSGPVAIGATAADNVGVAGVQFLLDGAAIGAEDTVAPYGLTWDSTSVSDGAHVWSAVARDTSGNLATATAVTVTVANGVVILRPQDTYLNLDATNYSAAPTLTTYTWPDFKPANAIVMKFDLSAVPPGAVVLQATLNLAVVQSDAVADAYAVGAQKVIGANPAIALATGYTTDGTTGWTPNPCCANGIPLAQADVSAPYDVQLLPTTAGFRQWTLTSMVQEWVADPTGNHGVVLNADALKPKDRYRSFASMEYADPTLRPFLRVSYSGADTSSPTVSITAPAAGATVSGTALVTANASDNVGVTGVQFKLDGVNLGAESTVAPFSTSWNSAATTNGSHALTAVARDAAGNTRASAGITVTVSNDTTLPTVSVTAPAAGATVSGTVTVRATASDNVGVAGVQFRLDGANIGVEDTTSSYSISWNSTSTTNGNHTLTAVARDAAGNVRTSAGITIKTSNDKTPPTVSITAPSSGASVAGTLTVRATASDNVGVRGVQFKLDGANLGSEDTSSAYSVSWNTTTATSGGHMLTAVARDAAGNTQTSAGVAVTVGNDTAPPVISLVAATSITVSSASIGWTTNEVSDSQVDYGVTTAYGTSTTLSTSLVTAHVVPLAGLSSGTTYRVRVRSRDAAGNLAVSGDFTLVTAQLSPPTGIAALYPGDVNIESNPNVVFVERFDEPALSDLFSRWTDILNGSAMSFTADVPPGSPGSRSLTIPWQGGGVNNGGHLFKQLPQGVDDTLYVRYYIKYPSSGTYQHSGVWMGGHNPSIGWPDPQAGLKPAGNDRFSAAAEQDPLTSRFDHYDYWMNMRQAVDGNYWGNRLLNNPAVSSPVGQWVCVEQMVKLNNPVSATNGEHAIWLNGVQVSHLGPGFPNGTWSGGNFTQTPAGSPFGGFQWRNDASLNLNWIWLQTYASTDPAGFQGVMRFDHLVAAKSYIGCLASDGTAPAVSVTAPSGGASVSGTATVSATASDNVGVVGVQFKVDGVNLGAEDTAAPYSVSWNSTAATNGSHMLSAVARDAAGNTTTSTGIPVTVANDTTPPVISSVAATGVTPLAATINWTTNELSDSQVDYGLTTSYGSSSALAVNLLTTHVAALAGLSPASTYHYRVRSRDAAGNLATSGDFTFVTSVLPDLIPPVVAIAAPTGGASVSATVAVSATASDNVAVAGVQFKVDGASVGAEDTAAPYAVNWDTTAAGNGAHVLTAVARDAAGNTTTSVGVSVSVNNVTGGGIVFESNWDTATGTSASAVKDGGRWPLYDEFNGGSSVQLLSVVAGGPNGHNALRVQQRGSSFAANLQKPAFMPASQDYYVRYYMKNDDTSAEGDHIVTPDIYHYENLIYMRKYSTAANWSFVIGVYGCGYTYPIGYWRPTATLAHGQWYRLEYQVHYTNATHIQVHPRIYDQTGNLIFSDAQFSQSDPGSASWNGRSDWTLASYYAGGNDFCVNPAYMNTFGVGNNGQQFAADTGQYWYFAGVQIRTDTWPGPIPSFAPEPAPAVEAVTVPPPSMSTSAESGDDSPPAWAPSAGRRVRRRSRPSRPPRSIRPKTAAPPVARRA